MSEFAKKVKKWYELGVWDERKVRDAVMKGVISEEQFKTITGKEYTAA